MPIRLDRHDEVMGKICIASETVRPKYGISNDAVSISNRFHHRPPDDSSYNDASQQVEMLKE